MKVTTKRLSTKVLLAGLFVAALTVVLSSVAHTTEPVFLHDISPSHDTNPNSSPCTMPGSDANGNLIFGGVGVVDSIKVTRRKIVLTCKGKNLINLSGRKQSFSGFLCGIDVDGDTLPDYITTDSYATVSKKGVGFMTCTVKLPRVPDDDDDDCDDDDEEDDDDHEPAQHHRHHDRD